RPVMNQRLNCFNHRDDSRAAPAVSYDRSMRGKRGANVMAIVFLAIGATGSYAWLTIRRGFSAHGEPSAIERVVARQVRSMAVPSRAKTLQNPVPLTDEALDDARAHFADHCASCH